MVQPFTFFISYRRADTAPIALLLKYEIEKRLQFVRVFVDVESLRPGESFPVRLAHAIDHSHAVIALIGDRWRSQIDGSIDWVAKELLMAKKQPLAMPEAETYGQEHRKIIPFFIDRDVSFADLGLDEELLFLGEIEAISMRLHQWGATIGPLLDSLAVRLKLKMRPDKDNYPPRDRAKARTQPVGDLELASTLEYDDYSGWYVDNLGHAEARYLTKTFKFADFNQAAEFMGAVAAYCDDLGHHPEWRNVFEHVQVALTTWDAERMVTIYDLNLALYMNKVAARLAAN